MIGVLISSSSFLITSSRSGRGLLGSSEGKVADFGKGLLKVGSEEGVSDLDRGLLVISDGKVAVLGVMRVKVGFIGDCGEVVLMVGVGKGCGREGLVAAGMVTVDLERPRRQMNDS